MDIMGIKEFTSIEEAVASFAKLDENYSFASHLLKGGEEIPLDSHPDNDEWIVIFNGECEVKVGSRRAEFECKNKAFIIHIPANTPHSFKALTPIYYWVYKSKP